MFRDPPLFLKEAYKRPAKEEVGVAVLKLSAERHSKSTFCLSPPNYECVKMTKWHLNETVVRVRGGNHRWVMGAGEGKVLSQSPLPVPIKKKQQEDRRS